MSTEVCIKFSSCSSFSRVSEEARQDSTGAGNELFQG